MRVFTLVVVDYEPTNLPSLMEAVRFGGMSEAKMCLHILANEWRSKAISYPVFCYTNCYGKTAS